MLISGYPQGPLRPKRSTDLKLIKPLNFVLLYHRLLKLRAHLRLQPPNR